MPTIESVDGQTVFVCVCGERWFELVNDVYVCKCGRRYNKSLDEIQRENLASPVFWVWKCRDCKKEYPEHYKFTTAPYKCDCGGMVDLCVSLSGYNAPVNSNIK